MEKRRRFITLEIIRPRRGRVPCLWQGSPTGITLIEILVVLFIMGMIAMALYGVLKSGLDLWRGGKERTDIIAQARVTMDRLTREAREATYMVSASDTKLRFSAYLLDTTNLKDVSYYYNSDQDIVYRYNVTDDTQAREMAKYMGSFSLYYYSKDMTVLSSPVTNPSDIWLIEIKSKAIRNDNIVNLKSTVQPRNYPYP